MNSDYKNLVNFCEEKMEEIGLEKSETNLNNFLLFMAYENWNKTNELFHFLLNWSLVKEVDSDLKCTIQVTEGGIEQTSFSLFEEIFSELDEFNSNDEKAFYIMSYHEMLLRPFGYMFLDFGDDNTIKLNRNQINSIFDKNREYSKNTPQRIVEHTFDSWTIGQTTTVSFLCIAILTLFCMFSIPESIVVFSLFIIYYILNTMNNIITNTKISYLYLLTTIMISIISVSFGYFAASLIPITFLVSHKINTPLSKLTMARLLDRNVKNVWKKLNIK